MLGTGLTGRAKKVVKWVIRLSLDRMSVLPHQARLLKELWLALKQVLLCWLRIGVLRLLHIWVLLLQVRNILWLHFRLFLDVNEVKSHQVNQIILHYSWLFWGFLDHNLGQIVMVKGFYSTSNFCELWGDASIRRHWISLHDLTDLFVLELHHCLIVITFHHYFKDCQHRSVV